MDKVKEMTEYPQNEMSKSMGHYIGQSLDPEGYIRNSKCIIKTFSEGFNLPLDHFQIDDSPKSYLEYLKTGKITISMSDEAYKRYITLHESFGVIP